MWQELYVMAYRSLRERGLSHADAEDLAQETLVAACMHMDAVEPGKLHAWVRAVARNRHVDLVRKRARAGVESEVPESLADASAPDPPSAALARAEVEGLRAVLGRLGERDRDLLSLHYLDELSLAEVASRLGLSVGTVKVGLHRARKRARAEYERQGESA